MSFALLTAALAAHAAVALVPQAPPCTVALRDERLVVLRGAQITATLALAPAQLPIQPGVEAPSLGVITTADPGRFFVGIREDWTVRGAAGLGDLFEVRCAGEAAPSDTIRVALSAKGVDFGTSRTLADGRVVVGGWGGLRVLDLDLRAAPSPGSGGASGAITTGTPRLTPLTTAPTFKAGACWSATEDKPAEGADVPDLRAGLHGPELPFLRGGACGYEGDMTMAPHVLDVSRGVYRKRVAISDLVTTEGAVVAAAGSCTRLDAGIWVSPDLVTWTRHLLGTGLPVARLARLDDHGRERWYALTAICPTGADRAGGDLYASDDLVAWTKVDADLGRASDGAVRGLGASELRAVDGVLFVGVREERGGVAKTRWVSSRDGLAFTTSAAPRPPAPTGLEGLLAARLGVDAVFGSALDLTRKVALAWTNDGLLSTPLEGAARPPKDATWTRILPWRGGSD